MIVASLAKTVWSENYWSFKKVLQLKMIVSKGLSHQFHFPLIKNLFNLRKSVDVSMIWIIWKRITSVLFWKIRKFF